MTDFAEAQARAAVRLIEVFGVFSTLVSVARRELTAAEKRSGRRDSTLDADPRRRSVRAAVRSAAAKGVEGRATQPTTCMTLVEPSVGDQLIQGARSWTVNEVKALVAGGKAVAYESLVS
jgi:hypothetical protein